MQSIVEKCSNTILPLVLLLSVVSCSTAPGPYVPTSAAPTVEDVYPAVLLDKSLRKRIAVDRVSDQRLQDNRLKVMANMRNMKGQGITVQVQTIYKDNQGFSIGDDTAWQTLIFSPNESKTYESVSMKSNASGYTIRIRHAE